MITHDNIETEILDYIQLQRKREEYTNILQMRCDLLKAELEALKKDVIRYFETRNSLKIKTVTENDIAILHALEEKLSKVGKEE